MKSSIEWLLFLNSWELFNHKSISWSCDVWTDKTWHVLVLKNQRIFKSNHQLSGCYSSSLLSYSTINPFLDHTMSEQKKRGMWSSLKITEYSYKNNHQLSGCHSWPHLGYSAINPILDHAMSERTKRGMWSSLRISEFSFEIINWVVAVLELLGAIQP